MNVINPVYHTVIINKGINYLLMYLPNLAIGFYFPGIGYSSMFVMTLELFVTS